MDGDGHDHDNDQLMVKKVTKLETRMLIEMVKQRVCPIIFGKRKCKCLAIQMILMSLKTNEFNENFVQKKKTNSMERFDQHKISL